MNSHRFLHFLQPLLLDEQCVLQDRLSRMCIFRDLLSRVSVLCDLLSRMSVLRDLLSRTSDLLSYAWTTMLFALFRRISFAGGACFSASTAWVLLSPPASISWVFSSSGRLGRRKDIQFPTSIPSSSIVFASGALASSESDAAVYALIHPAPASLPSPLCAPRYSFSRLSCAQSIMAVFPLIRRRLVGAARFLPRRIGVSVFL